MKKLIFCTLLILPILSFSQFRGVNWGSSKVVAQQNEKNKGTKCYISSETKYKFGTDDFLHCDSYLNSSKVNLMYHFINNKLVSGSYSIDCNYYKEVWDTEKPESYAAWQKFNLDLYLYENYLDFFEKFEKQLTKKYGPPKKRGFHAPEETLFSKNKTLEEIDIEVDKDLEFWEDQSKIYGKPQLTIWPKQRLAYKIAKHNLLLQSEWETKTSNIYCGISSNGFLCDFNVYITYYSKYHKDTRDKHAEKKQELLNKQRYGTDDY